MNRLAAALLGPLRREWRASTATAATDTDPAVRTTCTQLAHRAQSTLQAVADLLHAALEAHRPGSTLQAGIDAGEWYDRLQDQIDALGGPDPLSRDDLRRRCDRLGVDLGAHLQRQLLLASELTVEERTALARKVLQRSPFSPPPASGRPPGGVARAGSRTWRPAAARRR